MKKIEMVDIREFMRSQFEKDRLVNSVTVEGESIEEAIKQASIELQLPISGLHYEVLRKGRLGILGVGKVSWSLVVYESVKRQESQIEEEVQELVQVSNKVQRKDGIVIVKLSSEGVLLKVIKPLNNGSPTTERQAFEALNRRGITAYNHDLVARIVKNAEQEYVKVGEYDFRPESQPKVDIELSDQDMKAYMVVTAPGPGGTDLTYNEIIAYIEAAGVAHGLIETVIRDFEDFPKYDERFLVAEGTKPINGKDASFNFQFRVDRGTLNLKEKNGRINFKELDLIENVEAGQVVAVKIAAEDGQDGITVKGLSLPAHSGSDNVLPVGKNVIVSDDGKTATAGINGQVMFQKGKVTVEPIYLVSGDVNNATGNILFLGTVIIKGNVEDGFEVKAAGDIEVRGSVGKSILDAEGTITVHQGVRGKSSGYIRAGRDFYAKFIEHGRVEVERSVVVTDGIIHSKVDANQRIICQGKRAQIVGGRLRAAEEIHGKVLGSINGTETIIEAGYDPQSMERLADIRNRKERLERDLPEIELNLKTLESLKESDEDFSDEKEILLGEVKEKKQKATESLELANIEIAQIYSYLENLATKGRISASGQVHAGVKIHIKNGSPLSVRNDYKKVTFYLAGKEVKVTKYQESSEVAKRR